MLGEIPISGCALTTGPPSGGTVVAGGADERPMRHTGRAARLRFLVGAGSVLAAWGWPDARGARPERREERCAATSRWSPTARAAWTSRQGSSVRSGRSGSPVSRTGGSGGSRARPADRDLRRPRGRDRPARQPLPGRRRPVVVHLPRLEPSRRARPPGTRHRGVHPHLRRPAAGQAGGPEGRTGPAAVAHPARLGVGGRARPHRPRPARHPADVHRAEHRPTLGPVRAPRRRCLVGQRRHRDARHARLPGPGPHDDDSLLSGRGRTGERREHGRWTPRRGCG